jgi:hypothetical protein
MVLRINMENESQNRQTIKKWIKEQIKIIFFLYHKEAKLIDKLKNRAK